MLFLDHLIYNVLVSDRSCSEHLCSVQPPLSLSECNTSIISNLLAVDSILCCQQVLNILCKPSIHIKQPLVEVLANCELCLSFSNQTKFASWIFGWVARFFEVFVLEDNGWQRSPVACPLLKRDSFHFWAHLELQILFPWPGNSKYLHLNTKKRET